MRLVKKIGSLLLSFEIFDVYMIDIQSHLGNKNLYPGTKKDFIIRELNKEDSDNLENCLRKMEFHPPFTGDEAMVRLSQNMFSIIAISNNEIIGYLWGVLGSEYDDKEIGTTVRFNNKTGYICNAYVSPKYRGHNLYALLRYNAYKKFLLKSFETIVFFVYHWNKSASASMLKSGCQRCGHIYFGNFLGFRYIINKAEIGIFFEKRFFINKEIRRKCRI